jgi:hypothetical protein
VVEKSGDEVRPGIVPSPTRPPEDGIKVECPLCPPPIDNSNSIGIFLDGTGNHLDSITNVTRMYNVYNGSKAYYGGVGNWMDWSSGPGQISVYHGYNEAIGQGIIGSVEYGLGNTFGYGWTEVLNRAVADIRTQRDQYLGATGSQAKQFYVDIFGFSRGAAMAQDLAYRLEQEMPDVKVRFLGMFDPVYSKGMPGAWGGNPSRAGERGAG